MKNITAIKRLCAALTFCMPLGFTALISSCQDQLVTKNHSCFLLEQDEEALTTDLQDDPNEDGSSARALAIDTANQVRRRLKIDTPANVCVFGTASVKFRYKEGGATAQILSGTAISTKTGFRSFSIKREKIGTEILKTFDKTKAYTIYIQTTEAIPKVPAVYTGKTITTPAIPAVPVQWKVVASLSPDPPAARPLNKAGTKRIGRPIATTITYLNCPS